MNLALHLPINRLSFGQVSTLILRTLYEREMAGTEKHEIYLFPMGQIDLTCQQSSFPNLADFNEWVKSKIINGLENYSRDIPIFKLWHLSDSLQSFSNHQSLLSFYELDSPTKVELNIARNNKTYFSSRYSCNAFAQAGVDTKYLPLAFDSYNFQQTKKKFFNDDRIVFNLCGKFEKRKAHEKVIQAWIKRFGGNSKYSLHCAVYNQFVNEQQNQQLIANTLQGNKPFNVNFYPQMNENSIYNDFLNSADIVIGMSMGEGWDLPCFQSVAMGKHAVLLNAHVYRDWAQDDMVTWVMPSGKEPIYDGMFFNKGQAFNQGNGFVFNPDEFIASCEEAARKVEKSRINTAGLALQQSFSKEIFVDNVLNTLR